MSIIPLLFSIDFFLTLNILILPVFKLYINGIILYVPLQDLLFQKNHSTLYFWDSFILLHKAVVHLLSWWISWLVVHPPLMDTCFISNLVVLKVIMNILHQVSWYTCTRISLRYYLGPIQRVCIFLALIDNSIILFLFTLPRAVFESFYCFSSSPTLSYVILLSFVSLVDAREYPIVDFFFFLLFCFQISDC